MDMDFIEPQEDLHIKGTKAFYTKYIICTATLSLKKKKNQQCKTESVKEVDRITPAGPTPRQAADGREAIHRILEV